MYKQIKNYLINWSTSLIKPFFPVLILLLFFTLAGNYLSTFEPLFTGKIIDSLTQKNRIAFFYFLKITISFQIIFFLFSMLNSWGQFLLQRKMTIYTETRLYLNILYSFPKRIDKKNIGKLVNLFLSDLTVVINIYASQIPSILTLFVIMIVIGFRLLKIDIILFCLTTVMSVIPILLATYFGKKQTKVNVSQKKQQDEYTNFIVETINGLFEIKNYSAQNFFRNKFKDLITVIFIYFKKFTILKMQASFASFLSNSVINFSLFLILGISVLNEKNTIGTITAALMYSQKFRTVVSSCAELYKEIIISFVSVGRLKTIFDERHNQVPLLQKKEDTTKVKRIILENFSFAYINNRMVLKNINAEFSFPGLYLIKGENGSGKTTLLNILSGNILIRETRSTGKILFYNLKNKIAYVNQGSFVFTGTIAENIYFGKIKESSKLKGILSKTKLDKVIKNLPLGIDTKLGDNNYILSQGQKQCLALSRCLVLDTEIILLDEVENGLDLEATEALTKLLSELKMQKLILMVTHKDTYDKIASGILDIRKN